MSSMEMYLVVYHGANLRPDEPLWPARDRIVVSHGHTSPGAYAALADAGFFPIEQAVAHFRQAESPFEGHVERTVPGIEWNTGNLGQGLSAALGMAMASRITGTGWHTFCLMGDGGQHKGQVAEARRVAVHHEVSDLTVLIDRNNVQISGHAAEVMGVDLRADWEADGWRVLEVDGHDVERIYEAVHEAVHDERRPVAIICHTTIGKGVSFMEDDPHWHGAALDDEGYAKAMRELGLEPYVDRARAQRSESVTVSEPDISRPRFEIDTGTPRTYTREKDTDNRSAWGAALADISQANPDTPMAVVDCDLVPSVKTGAFRDARPEDFIQAGIGEHNAAAMAGAMSVSGVLTFWADFGVFGLDEVYNQQRLNDINMTSLKLALTHCGLDVGEDGKTHQCLDYVGAFKNMFGWKVIVPADPNQTDRAVRWAARAPGDIAVAMGRSKLPVILDEEGRPLFGGEAEFEYGRIVWAREGADATILAMGTVAPAAVDAADALRDEGLGVGVGIVACPLALDGEALRRAVSHDPVFTVEDHNVRTGLGATVAEWLGSNGHAAKLQRLGVERYSSSGAAGDLLHIAGLDAEGISAAVRMAI
jgi:transketolase